VRFTERIGRLFVVLLLALCSSIAGGAESRPRLIQSVDIQIPVEPSPLRIAGKTRLVYELHITNFTSSDIVLTRVEVLDAARGTRLADFRDAALADKLGRPGLKSTSGNTQLVAGGMRAVMYLWLTLADATPTPQESGTASSSTRSCRRAANMASYAAARCKSVMSRRWC
jgi:murein DD-endopeptidase